jgi:hypothetical protein
MANANAIWLAGRDGAYREQIPVKLEHECNADIALWYGAIHCPAPCQSNNLLLRRLFGVLYYGGIHFMTREGVWHDWGTDLMNTPVASALSHGARVLIQLPPIRKDSWEAKPLHSALTSDKKEKIAKVTINTFADTTGDYSFWNWLNADHSAQERTVSTHGLTLADTPTLTTGNHRLFLEEIKTEGMGSMTCSNTVNAQHYALNVPLGGYQHVSAIGKGEIVMGDGLDGHLYLLYLPPGQYYCGGLLVGCENAQFGKGENRHTAGGHSDSGMPNAVSATGGLKWAALRQVVNPCPRGEKGDIFVNLIGRLNEVKNQAEGFDPANLDERPRQAGNPGEFSILMTCQQWQLLTNTVADANRSLELKSIDIYLVGLNSTHPTKTQLKQLIKACETWAKTKRSKFCLAEQQLDRQVGALLVLAEKAKKDWKC